MSEETRRNILYAPLWAILHGVALLPFCVLYRISDILFFIMYYIIPYRKNVVCNNIAESFPEKSIKEQKQIIRQFYRNFADYFFETIKLLHISDNEMRKRVTFKNIELIDNALDSGKSVAMYLGHLGNWEYVTSVTLWTRHTPEECVFAQIYRPLRNKWFDKFFLDLRARFHSRCLTKKNSFRDLIKIKREGKLSITGFISDQHPSGNDTDFVTRFLNHDTAIITGTEQIVRKMDMTALYFDIDKPKRGFYTISILSIADEPSKTAPFYITSEYARLLQSNIRRNPPLWLWTHKRWKHKCPPISHHSSL